MSAMTSPLRMPSYFYNDLTSIVSSLAPLNKCHFAIAGYTPFSAEVVESVPPPSSCCSGGSICSSHVSDE